MKMFLIAIINLILTSSLALASEKLGEAICFKEAGGKLQGGNSSTAYDELEPFKIDFDERISRSSIGVVNTSNNVTVFTEEESNEGKNGKESYFSVGTIDKNNNKHLFTTMFFTLADMKGAEDITVMQISFSCFFLE